MGWCRHATPVHTVAEIRRAIGRQTVMLQPRVRDVRLRRLELVPTNVHGATGNAGVAIQIRTGRRRGVGAGVEARRVGLQSEVAACVIHEEWSVSEIANPVCGKRCRARVTQMAVVVVVLVRPARSSVVIRNAIFELAVGRPAPVTACRVADECAVVQCALARPSVFVGRVIAFSAQLFNVPVTALPPQAAELPVSVQL